MAQVLANVSPIETISELDALATGNLRITVGDYGVIVGGDPTINQYQQRTYGWNGQRFVQVAGPTSFPPNPRLADLTVTAPALAFGASTGSIRTARLTVTARNLGPSAVWVALAVQVPGFVRLVTGPNGCATAYYPSGAFQVECIIRSLAANSSKEMVFTFRAPANADTLTSEFVTAVRVQIPTLHQASISPGGFDDPVPENNSQDLIIAYD